MPEPMISPEARPALYLPISFWRRNESFQETFAPSWSFVLAGEIAVRVVYSQLL